MKYTLEAYNGRAESLNDLNSDLLIDTITFERWFLKEGVKVERASVSKEGFLGTLFIPEGEGPHPGQILIYKNNNESQVLFVSFSKCENF